MKLRPTPLFHLLLIATTWGASTATAQVVLVKPYIQPGNGSSLATGDVKVIRWLTDQVPGDFAVEYGVKDKPLATVKPERTSLDFGLPAADAKTNPAIPENEQHYFRYAVTLPNLPLDAQMQYRVKLGATIVRESAFRTRASRAMPVKFVMVGDLADGKAFQNEVADRISRSRPDFMVVLGDIVYPLGRVSQYMDHFWSTYCNVENASAATGAPLMASMLLYPALGNHDVAARLAQYPDALGAYHFFDVPTNGPGEGPWLPPMGSDKAAQAAFRTMAGAAFPALGFYSFDDGPAHILVLDSSDYVAAGAPKLVEWIERDLKGTDAPWKFVCFHSPAFHTSQQHFTEQKMRLLEPIFERCGVDVVFAGHVHNYQRSKPLHFTPTDPTKREPRGTVSGAFKIDQAFDGAANTHPDGIIHIVSGGGGANLYVTNDKTIDAVKKENPPSWAPFTARYFSGAHCFALVELTPVKFHLRTLTLKGDEVDQITIDKPGTVKP